MMFDLQRTRDVIVLAPLYALSARDTVPALLTLFVRRVRRRVNGLVAEMICGARDRKKE
jgi:hypothetical protein